MKKRLKIAMFFSSDPSTAGGVQEHILFLTKELRKRGHKITIFGPEKNVLPYINYRVIAKSVILPVPNGNWGNITLEKKDKIISKIIKQGGFDLIHIHEPYIPFINWEIIKDVTLPKVATFHTAWDNDSIVNFINPFISLFKEGFSKSFSGVIFVSKIAKKRWQDLCKKNVIKQVIHNAVDRSFFPIKKEKTKIVNLLYVGRIVSRKGLQYLLKAFNKIKKDLPKIKLTILGEGPLRESLKEYVRNNSLGRLVDFKGEIIGKEKIRYYQNADIFCAPYSDESFALTVLEAMACGLPIVGFKNEAFKEILKDYPYKQFLVEPKDTGELAKALKKLIYDEKIRSVISSWSIKESKKYSWEKVAEETEKLYFQILKYE
ncbi:glycosyltransferase family 4 protein [Candidatus Roizmanbacteria bacterium]|nr:glycosyltransferase family 4 protein [Candidatus Roizmanbacteria bacterium]